MWFHSRAGLAEDLARSRFPHRNAAEHSQAPGGLPALGSPADIDVVIGDARVSMANEPPQRHDVIVVDAFSGDAIPVHLITLERGNACATCDGSLPGAGPRPP